MDHIGGSGNRARPRGRPGLCAPLAALAVAVILSLVATQSASAQDTGTADLLLRYPPQVTFTVWGNGATYNEILLEADPGDALNATLLVKFRGRDNTLTEPRNFTVAMSLARGDNVTELALVNGTITPGEARDIRITLNGTVPDDVEGGAYQVRFHLTSGAYDPNLDNNDPRPVPLRIGNVTRADGIFAMQGRHLVGPVVFTALIAAPVAYRFVHRRPWWTTARDRFVGRIDTWTAGWYQADPGHRQRLGLYVTAGIFVAGFVATLIAVRGLARGFGGLRDAFVLAVVGLLFHFVGATLANVRNARDRDRVRGAARTSFSAHLAPAVEAAARSAALTMLVVFFAALLWQQLAALTTVFRWPDFDTLVGYVIIGLRFGAVYALIALGYTMVYGVLKFINFAHGELFTWGAYFIWLFTVSDYPFAHALDSFLPAALLFPAAVLVGVLLAGGLGALTERVAYRRLRGASRLAPLVTAIALSVFLQATAQFFFGASTHTYTEPGNYRGSTYHDFFSRRIVILGESVDFLALTVIATSVLLMVGLALFIKFSKTGRAMRAIADDLDTARMIGIRVDRIISITFVLGSMLAAVGGLLYALRFGMVPTNGLTVGIKAFTAAVVGGIGNIYGAFLGGLVIGLAENVGSQFLDIRFQRAIPFAILVAFLLFRPRGILGATEEVRK